jgi:hypothetical protein
MGCSFGKDTGAVANPTTSHAPKPQAQAHHEQKQKQKQKQPVHVPPTVPKKVDVHPPPAPAPAPAGDSHVHIDKHGQLVDNTTGGRVFEEAEKWRNEAERFAK